MLSWSVLSALTVRLVLVRPFGFNTIHVVFRMGRVTQTRRVVVPGLRRGRLRPAGGRSQSVASRSEVSRIFSKTSSSCG